MSGLTDIGLGDAQRLLSRMYTHLPQQKIADEIIVVSGPIEHFASDQRLSREICRIDNEIVYLADELAVVRGVLWRVGIAPALNGEPRP